MAIIRCLSAASRSSAARGRCFSYRARSSPPFRYRCPITRTALGVSFFSERATSGELVPSARCNRASARKTTRTGWIPPLSNWCSSFWSRAGTGTRRGLRAMAYYQSKHFNVQMIYKTGSAGQRTSNKGCDFVAGDGVELRFSKRAERKHALHTIAAVIQCVALFGKASSDEGQEVFNREIRQSGHSNSIPDSDLPLASAVLCAASICSATRLVRLLRGLTNKLAVPDKLVLPFLRILLFENHIPRPFSSSPWLMCTMDCTPSI